MRFYKKNVIILYYRYVSIHHIILKSKINQRISFIDVYILYIFFWSTSCRHYFKLVVSIAYVR